MPASLQEQWLADTRRFWDTDSQFDAKYRRICSDPDIDATDDPAALEALWDRRTAEELPQLLEGIPLAADWTCIEIGCGVGRLIAPIAARCRRVIGFDISEKMVAQAGEYLAGVPNAEVRLNDGATLGGIADESVDWVYSHLAFQHMTLPRIVESYLAEIRRVLRPGGYCRIQCWREADLSMVERAKNLARRLLGRETYHGPRRWLWSPGREVKFGGITFHPREWGRLLAAHGLRVEAMQLGMGHEYWMWTTGRKA